MLASAKQANISLLWRRFGISRKTAARFAEAVVKHAVRGRHPTTTDGLLDVYFCHERIGQLNEREEAGWATNRSRVDRPGFTTLTPAGPSAPKTNWD